MSGSSASAIVELSRSRSRYNDQDALLKAFIGCAGFTAKEVAVEVLDWRYEQYANSPKRAFDLQRLGYLEELEGKLCRQTGKMAHSYRITDKGLEHLRSLGISLADLLPAKSAASEDQAANQGEAKRGISDMRKFLGG